MIKGYYKRANFLYCSIYFAVGAMIYLYREFIEKTNSPIWLMLGCVIAVFYYCSESLISIIGLCVVILSYAISQKNRNAILDNRFTNFISSISLEIYLSHMMIYRLLEKGNMIRIFDNELMSYIFTSVLTFVGAVVFVVIVKQIIKNIDINIFYMMPMEML